MENSDEKSLFLSEKPLILYGMGYIGKHVAAWCDKNGVDYIFADQDAAGKKAETRKKVIFPEEISSGYPDAKIMITSINYFDEIKNYLTNELGVSEERVFSYLSIWPEKVPWEELENSVDWEQVRKRAGIFASWIDDSVRSVTDYSCERNFLKEFLREGVLYCSPEYFCLEDNVPAAHFENLEEAPQTDAASCLAMLMSFGNPDDVISYMCAHTKRLIVASYVPLEKIPDIRIRRSINYNNDMTEAQFIEKFEENGFSLVKKEPDPFDFVNVVYLFVR